MVSRCQPLHSPGQLQRPQPHKSYQRPFMKTAQIVPCGHIGLLSEALRKVCPESSVCMLSLVMYRYSPIWDSERLPEVLHGYSQILSCGKPPNLHLLSGFPTPEYNKEGEYMTTFSRLEFLLHLFEGAEAAIKDFAPSPVEVLLQQYGQQSSGQQRHGA